jgi:hypothetical protein
MLYCRVHRARPFSRSQACPAGPNAQRNQATRSRPLVPARVSSWPDPERFRRSIKPVGYRGAQETRYPRAGRVASMAVLDPMPKFIPLTWDLESGSSFRTHILIISPEESRG